VLPPFRAVTIDVGGVLLVPSHVELTAALLAAGVAHDPSLFWDAHYQAMHAIDLDESPPETFNAYVPAFVSRIGVDDHCWEDALEAVAALFGPSRLWHQPIEESVADLRTLVDAGVPTAIVSNADGSVASILAAAGVCQEGDGPFVPVRVIVDSGAVGVAKPHPGIFDHALRVLGTTPAETLHLGDSVHYDVKGAEGAGLIGAHFDPRHLCERTDHPHVRRLTDLLTSWSATSPGGP
jgi:putative hydrolase of the HAD superfamily